MIKQITKTMRIHRSNNSGKQKKSSYFCTRGLKRGLFRVETSIMLLLLTWATEKIGYLWIWISSLKAMNFDSNTISLWVHGALSLSSGTWERLTEGDSGDSRQIQMVLKRIRSSNAEQRKFNVSTILKDRKCSTPLRPTVMDILGTALYFARCNQKNEDACWKKKP